LFIGKIVDNKLSFVEGALINRPPSWKVITINFGKL